MLVEVRRDNIKYISNILDEGKVRIHQRYAQKVNSRNASLQGCYLYQELNINYLIHININLTYFGTLKMKMNLYKVLKISFIIGLLVRQKTPLPPLQC